MIPVDEALLDDADGLGRADTGQCLLTLAGAGAHVRRASWAVAEAGLGTAARGDRPRIIAVAVAPHCGPVTASLDALTASGASVPIVEVSGDILPGWIGPLDLLVLAGPRGEERALLALVRQAYRRGCGVAVVAPEGSSLDAAAEQARGLRLHTPAAPVGAPERVAARDAFWPLLGGLLALARSYGVGSYGPGESFDALADRLDAVGLRCRPSAETYLNPAKSLALDLSGAVPVIWGTGPIMGVAAARFAAALTSVAGLPALHGTLPDAAVDSGNLFDGSLGRASGDSDDFFRDRVEEPEPMRLRPVVLVDDSEPGIRRQVDLVRRVAVDLALPFNEITAEGPDPLARFGEVVALGDFAAVYLALTTGHDTGSVGSFDDFDRWHRTDGPDAFRAPDPNPGGGDGVG
ncbi:mannose-6-phosphate isomerase [Yinghuangia sp. ASG 101]|uniref:SIS domain-containing protein n=1 Tax=Yinghuangia sp. ASG 101 TaxID=2896848 RepID=UPI001E2FB50E|nr:SIS domain-containing protein [Yinghuangia sp. ASG 101]UGQ09543.1 mannose-6-phosphate isomerase [Yinghuangia sp. ASG 101]